MQYYHIFRDGKISKTLSARMVEAIYIYVYIQLLHGYLCVSNPHLSLDILREWHSRLYYLAYFIITMVLKCGPLKLFRLGIWGPFIINMFTGYHRYCMCSYSEVLIAVSPVMYHGRAGRL